MKDLNWSKKGILLNGKYLSNLRFADDITIFSNSSNQLENMVEELSKVSNDIGLQLNTSKTKVATNSAKNSMRINDITLEYVENYTYLGKQISFKNTRHSDELERRINITWKKYWYHKEVLKSKLPLKLKKKIMDSCILPCLTYGAQTWTFNKSTVSKLRSCQRAMERSILGLRLIDKQKSSNIRNKTKVIDAVQHALRLKWRWAGHLARMSDDRWTKQATLWKGPGERRNRGRPRSRWSDDIVSTAGRDWIDTANDRNKWRRLEEAYTERGHEFT